jgi:hypothetical protein
MKKLFLFITIVAVNIMYGQEKSSLNELNPPLNIYQCTNCIDENPTLNFNNVNDLQKKCENLFKLIGDSYIPVTIYIDSKGILKSIDVFYQVSPIEEKIINNPNVIQFLNSLTSYKIASFKSNPKGDIFGKVILKLNENHLTILN